MSDVVVVTPRSGDMVALATVKAFLRVEHGDHDTLIRSHIEAAAAWLDGPSGWLGLALGAQTLRLTVDHPGRTCDDIELPCGPVQAVDGITYQDAAGVTVDVADDVFELVEDANRVRLMPGQSWPSACGPYAITYSAGYAVADLPATIANAVMLHVKILYDSPEGGRLDQLERSRDALLSPVRVWRI